MDILDFSVANDWGSGFTGSLSITNPNPTALNQWVVEFEAPFEITDIWNAEIISREGNRYIIRNANWNGAIASGQTVTFGFNGKKATGVTLEPQNYKFNGVALDPGPAPAEPPFALLPELAIADTSVVEANNAQAKFVINLSEPSTQNISVEYSTNSLTAKAGSDYRSKSGTLTFAPGETSKTVSVAVLNDTLVENSETFELNLARANNATIASGKGIATILDDDEATPTPAPAPVPAPAPAPAPAPTPAPVPAPDSTSPSSESSVDFSVANNWGSGFTANLSFTNAGNAALNGWTLEFSAPFEMTNIWGAELVRKEGDRYVISPASWNSSVAPGQTISFGFNANGAATEPTSYELNGSPLSAPPSAPPADNPEDDPAPSPPPVAETPVDNTPDSSSEPNEPIDSGEPITPDASADPPSPDPTAPAPGPQSGDFNYGEALQKSLLFIEAQRSGPLPDDTRIEWRGDSAVNDGADVGLDLSGGYYDAGDHVKFGFPMASSMTMLSWGVVEYRDGYAQSGQLDEALEAIKWGADYILKAHVTDSQGTKEFWGQVGNGNIDHAYWGTAETMTMERPAYKIDRQNPGSDLAAESAAALASASIAFKTADPDYADRLLTNAKQLFEFADQYRGKYSDSITDARSFYNSWSGYIDELVWGATWLYKATGEQKYLNKAEQLYQGLNPQWTHNWDDKSYGAAVLLAQETGKARYRNDVEGWLDYWSDSSGDGVNYTSGGLAWLSQWGSLRYSSTTAFIAGVYSDTVNDKGDRYSNFAENQIDYILGENPNNLSYMVGFGDSYPLNPHHRNAHGGGSINDPAPNDNILFGALVGGPASPNDNDYADVRSDYIRNEVALDYNAGFTGALARMYDMFGGQPLSDAQLNALPGIVVADA